MANTNKHVFFLSILSSSYFKNYSLKSLFTGYVSISSSFYYNKPGYTSSLPGKVSMI